MSASIQFLRDDRGAAAYQARKPAVTIAYLDRFFSQLRWTTLREAEDQVRRMLDDHTLPVEAIASGIVKRQPNMYQFCLGKDSWRVPVHVRDPNESSDVSWRKEFIQPLVWPVGPIPVNQSWVEQINKENRLRGSAEGPQIRTLHHIAP